MRIALKTTPHFRPLGPDSPASIPLSSFTQLAKGLGLDTHRVMCGCVAIRQEGCKIRHVALPRSKYAFLTLPRYSMIALSNAVEPLRMANIITGRAVYDWSIVSLDGRADPREQRPGDSSHHSPRAARADRYPVRVRRRRRSGRGVAEDRWRP